MRAIVSVSDKAGIANFARSLQELDIEIFSTGGTKKSLELADVKVHGISELTGFPEILDGRVKTLHPAVHGGILAKRNLPQHLAELAKNHIETIDMVVVNLYPFVQTVTKGEVSLDEALENIDIGGPTLIRAAAKNFPSVLVLVDPRDYDKATERLRQGNIDLKERKRLAQKAFQHVALYDTAIAQYLREEEFPEEMTIALKRSSELPYGENPHQQAALYIEQSLDRESAATTSATLLSGPEVSFNNLLDLDAALSVVSSFTKPTVTIIKHTNPCGLASHDDLTEAYRRALAGDPIAAFGGIVATNQTISLATATEINKSHYDIIIAPRYEEEAIELLRRKRKLRLLNFTAEQGSNKAHQLDFRRLSGGFLAQTPDFFTESEFKPKMVTNRQPNKAQWQDLFFAWRAVKHVKSNAIVIAKDEALLGMGAGQPSRVVSVELALKKAGDRAKGSVLASDAFFPFTDAIELAAKSGVTAIIQPGGSIRDEEVIAAANQCNIAMVFTGVRHFRH